MEEKLDDVTKEIDKLIKIVFDLPDYIEADLEIESLTEEYQKMFNVREIIHQLFQTRSDIVFDEAKDICTRNSMFDFISYLRKMIVGKDKATYLQNIV